VGLSMHAAAEGGPRNGQLLFMGTLLLPGPVLVPGRRVDDGVVPPARRRAERLARHGGAHLGAGVKAGEEGTRVLCVHLSR
jgi:hypothetical protein